MILILLPAINTGRRSFTESTKVQKAVHRNKNACLYNGRQFTVITCTQAYKCNNAQVHSIDDSLI